jgi:hypothetical protein
MRPAIDKALLPHYDACLCSLKNLPLIAPDQLLDRTPPPLSLPTGTTGQHLIAFAVRNMLHKVCV